MRATHTFKDFRKNKFKIVHDTRKRTLVIYEIGLSNLLLNGGRMYTVTYILATPPYLRIFSMHHPDHTTILFFDIVSQLYLTYFFKNI